MAKDFEKLIEDSFVYSIRKKGSLKEYIPFWNLKLSFKEYECLKSHLKYHISSKKEYSSLDFAVYISEWWRRECCNKNYTENISQSLDLNDNGIIRNAVGGISEIDTFCDIYRANVYQRKLDSIMFKDGLEIEDLSKITNYFFINYNVDIIWVNNKQEYNFLISYLNI